MLTERKANRQAENKKNMETESSIINKQKDTNRRQASRELEKRGGTRHMRESHLIQEDDIIYKNNFLNNTQSCYANCI